MPPISTATITRTQAAALARYKRLMETSNKTFLPLYFCRAEWLVIGGGAGSGKSNFAADKVIDRCMSEPGHRFLTARKVFNTIRRSCYDLLCAEIDRLYPGCGAVTTVSPMQISFPNGSVIFFAGCDNVEKLKSIYHVTSIWVEEASELLEGDLSQLDIRLRDESPYYKQIILTFNPVAITHWIKRRFFDTPSPNVVTHRSTYKDNRFMPAEYGAKLESYRNIDTYYYTVYCLGEWGVLGRTVFDARAVSERLAAIRGTQHVAGMFSYVGDGRDAPSEPVFISSSGEGVLTAQLEKELPVRIYVPAEEGRTYVIGADTAGTGSDSFAAHVLDAETDEQCAVIHMKTGETEFLCQLWCLAREYGFPVLAVEANFSTYVINKLQEWEYPRQYVREVEDTYTHKMKAAYGFLTTQKSRNAIIANLLAAMSAGGYGKISDEATLGEMLTFVRSEDWRAEAEDGAHDDLIMSLAIAHKAKDQVYIPPRPDETPRVKWYPDQWEDYYNATDEVKRYLIEKWGKPEEM